MPKVYIPVIQDMDIDSHVPTLTPGEVGGGKTYKIKIRKGDNVYISDLNEPGDVYSVAVTDYYDRPLQGGFITKAIFNKIVDVNNMAKFHLRGRADIAPFVDDFTMGYIEAMFFTAPNGDNSDSQDLSGASTLDLAVVTILRIMKDCAEFRNSLPTDHVGRTALDMAVTYAPTDYTESKAGQDFWFTRNGHGTGYEDRGLGPVGDTLVAAARKYGEITLYRGGDEKLYFS